MSKTTKRAILIVLDSVGIGAAPDAHEYRDEGSATLQHTSEAVGGLKLPVMEDLGLGNIPSLLPDTPPILGVHPQEKTKGSWGAMQEQSQGKDTITGHWEIAGLNLRPGFELFPSENSFPEEILSPFQEQTGRSIIGNCAASGTQIVKDMGAESVEKEAFIVYTSADSVMQIAAHVDVIPLDELYKACQIARKLCDPYRVGRVIARPFTGNNGNFVRTDDRKDFAYATEEDTILQRLQQHGVPTRAVGKIEDIFASRGIDDSVHTPDNESSQEQVLRYMDDLETGLIFANFIDFDMKYGHRRDPQGYGKALEQTDQYLQTLMSRMKPEDLLMVTADHGNDPTFRGTDHTREYVPVLVYQPQQSGRSLGLRQGFYDIAQTLSSWFSIPPHPRGTSFFAS